jgi:hypothetical protein
VAEKEHFRRLLEVMAGPKFTSIPGSIRRRPLVPSESDISSETPITLLGILFGLEFFKENWTKKGPYLTELGSVPFKWSSILSQEDIGVYLRSTPLIA